MDITNLLDPFASNRPYLKEKYHRNIISFRPKSTVDSYYYDYVQSPLCDYIVERLPSWLAPNTITIWGFAWNMACLLLTLAFYGNSTDGFFSPYLAYFVGVSYFIYTTADNTDGKQARKNGTGSVMGMLFDHGLDATTAIVMNLVLTRIVGVGPGLPALLAIQISTIPFYFLTLEDYYIGMLHLPIFTGPDDTSLLISGICFFSAYIGSDYWTDQVRVPFGLHEMVGIPPTMKRSSFAVFCIFYLEVIGVLAGSL